MHYRGLRRRFSSRIAALRPLECPVPAVHRSTQPRRLPHTVNPIEEAHTIMSLSDYFRSQADWRRQKAEEYPEDARNLQSARALDSLAEYVERHAPHASAGAIVEALTPHIHHRGFGLGGEETHRVVARYGFGRSPKTPAHHQEFLEELQALCLEDAYEFAREHGIDWTDTLYQHELDAAAVDIDLPRRYWERRAGSTEQECERAVKEYGPRSARVLVGEDRLARAGKLAAAGLLKDLERKLGRVDEQLAKDPR